MNTGVAAMKTGERVWIQCEVAQADRDGDGDMHLMAVDSDGTTRADVWVAPDAATLSPPPDHSQYIGKTLAEVPDGTMAVVTVGVGNKYEVRRLFEGMVQQQNGAGDWLHTLAREAEYTIFHIIKLGEPKPQTLAEAATVAAIDAQENGNCVVIPSSTWSKVLDALEREQQPSA